MRFFLTVIGLLTLNVSLANNEPVNKSLVLFNSTTNISTVFQMDKIEMVLTQKGYNVGIYGTAMVDGEAKKGSCLIQSFKVEVIFPLYQAMYANFNTPGQKNFKIKCSAKTIEGPAIVMLDIGQGDLSLQLQ